jgi:hypothetical protein
MCGVQTDGTERQPDGRWEGFFGKVTHLLTQPLDDNPRIQIVSLQVYTGCLVCIGYVALLYLTQAQ